MNKELNNAEKEPTLMSLVYVKNRSSKVWSIGHYLGKKNKWYYIAEMEQVGFDEMSVVNPYEYEAENELDNFMEDIGGNSRTIKIKLHVWTAVCTDPEGSNKMLCVRGEIENHNLIVKDKFPYYTLSALGYLPENIIKEATQSIIQRLLKYGEKK